MADPTHPTVPDAAGVPPVNRKVGTTPPPVVPETNDSNTIVVTAPSLKWAIHKQDGSSYFPKGDGPDSYVEVDDSLDWSIPDYPTESGGFESFNKVTKPGEVHLTAAKGGSVGDRQAFRQRLDTLAASTDLVNIITPGRTYKKYNLTRMEVDRTAESGAQLLRIRLTFTQVRTTVTAKFTNVEDASAASNVNDGAVQPSTPSPSQTPTRAPQ